MHAFSRPLLLSVISVCLALTQAAFAQSAKEIQDYCQSMGSAGMSAEETKSFIDECIAEQSSYLEQEYQPEQAAQYEDNNNYEDNSSYEDSSHYESTSYEDNSYEESSYQESSYESAYQEPQYEQEDYGHEQNCYAKVDEQIQKLLDSDPNFAFDYDQMVDQCLNGKI